MSFKGIEGLTTPHKLKTYRYMVKRQSMKRTYSYYSNSKRAYAHVDAKNKKEVLEFARNNGDNIKLSDISLLMVNNVYVK